MFLFFDLQTSQMKFFSLFSVPKQRKWIFILHFEHSIIFFMSSSKECFVNDWEMFSKQTEQKLERKFEIFSFENIFL